MTNRACARSVEILSLDVFNKRNKKCEFSVKQKMLREADNINKEKQIWERNLVLVPQLPVFLKLQILFIFLVMCV